MRITHNYAPPDPLKVPSASIFRISNNRYWTVEGIFPGGFKTKGIFQYNRTTNLSSGYLDNEFLPTISSLDSLVLVYRSDASDDWKIVNFTKTGNILIGDLTTNDLKPGEYTLGIGLPGQSGIKQAADTKQFLNVFPNPSDKKIHITINNAEASIITICDSNGKLLETITTKAGNHDYMWDPRSHSEGTYFIQLFNKKHQQLEQKKFVYIRK